MYTYKADVIRVIDGDTYEVCIDLGFNLSYICRIRLKGIDTPETWRPSSNAELLHGEQAKEFVTNLIQDQIVTIITDKDPGAYNRYVANVILNDDTDLAELLIEEGFEKLEIYDDNTVE